MAGYMFADTTVRIAYLRVMGRLRREFMSVIITKKEKKINISMV